MRLFVAINPDAETRDWLADEQSQLQQTLTSHERELRWIGSEALHITLAFLGEIADPEPVAAALAACRPRISDLELGGLGVFPNPRRPSVLWMGCSDATGELFVLQAEVAEAMRPFVEPERRAFTPHLTLARIKPGPRSRLGHDVQAMNTVARRRWRNAGFSLMRSTTAPEGARYEVLQEFVANSVA